MGLLRHTVVARPQLAYASLSCLLDCNRRLLLPRAFAQLASHTPVPVRTAPPPPPEGNAALLSKRLEGLRKKRPPQSTASASSNITQVLTKKQKKIKQRKAEQAERILKAAKAKQGKRVESSDSNEGSSSVAPPAQDAPSEPVTPKSRAKITLAKAKLSDLEHKALVHQVLDSLLAPGAEESGLSRLNDKAEVLKAIDHVISQLPQGDKKPPYKERRKRSRQIRVLILREIKEAKKASSSILARDPPPPPPVPAEPASAAKLRAAREAKSLKMKGAKPPRGRTTEKLPRQEEKKITAAFYTEGDIGISQLDAEWPPKTWKSGWGIDKLAPPAPAEGELSGVSEQPPEAPKKATSTASPAEGEQSDVLEQPSEAPKNATSAATPQQRTRLTKDAPPHVDVIGGARKFLALAKDAVVDTIEGELNPKDLIIESVQPPWTVEVPRLAHGLDRALFNPAVYWLQDPHSRVYNFEPYLQRLISPDDFAYDRLPAFVSAARDEELWKMAEKHDSKYIGSSSGLTGILSHIYWMISRWKEVDTSTLSQAFATEPRTFTFGSKMPISIFLRYRDGRYAIDPDKSWDMADGGKAAAILMHLGTLMEKLMTMDPETFGQLLKSNPEIPGKFKKRESYYYSKSSKLLMRSQLDCQDARLPGTGTFDLKTRGVMAIRRDRLNYVENSGYLINNMHGLFNSFEREYYDMIRSAFLKYNLQVRIGNMDGIFVAYHNTAQIFGFQYISRDEMDERLFGSPDMGDGAFKLSVALLEKVLDEAVSIFPEQTLRITFETKENEPYLQTWVEPDEWDSVTKRPLVQLDMKGESTLNGHKVTGWVDFDAVRDSRDETVNWNFKYNIFRSSDHPAVVQECRKRLDQARQRQREVVTLFLPEGVEREEMLAKFDTMDIADIIRTRQTPSESESEHKHLLEEKEDSAAEEKAGEVQAEKSEEGQADQVDAVEAEQVDTVEAEQVGAIEAVEERERRRGLRFSRPHPLILRLRRLSRAGHLETKRLHELQSGKEKVVWRPGEVRADERKEEEGLNEPSQTEAGEKVENGSNPWWKVW